MSPKQVNGARYHWRADEREKILFIRLKSIGDILFTLPAIHAVRENFPDAKLHFLVSKEYAPLLRGFSEIDEIIPFDRAAYRTNGTADLFKPLSVFLHCRLPFFPASLIFSGETAWLTCLSGASEDWNWQRVSAGPRLKHTRGVRLDQKLHPAEWNLSMLRQCGLQAGEIRNEYILPADAIEKARRFFEANKLDENKPTLFIQPFTSSPAKTGRSKFLKWAGIGDAQRQVLFGGGVSERAALEPAQSAGFPISAGAPLLVSAGLMKLSTTVIGGDTGLLHLAVAMGRRVVMIVRSSTQGETPPFQHAGDWCFRRTIQPEINAVIEATTKAMNEKIRLPGKLPDHFPPK